MLRNGECPPARGRVLFLKAVGSGVPWSLPELNDEVAFEVRQLKRPQVRIHAVRVKTGDLAGLPINGGKARNAGPRHFDEHARGAGTGKPEAKKCATFRGRHFGADAAAFRGAERHGIVIRVGGFVAVGESELASFRRCAEFADLRHQSDVTVVAHPDRRLMSADEAGDGRVVVLIRGDADLVLPGLWRPVGHCERRGDKRHRPAITDSAFLGSDQGIDVSKRIAVSGAKSGGKKEADQNSVHG